MRFDACAESYDTYALPQRHFAEKVAEFAEFPPGSTVLELGAGTGGLTRFLVESGLTVIATDLSRNMVRLGREAVPGAVWNVLDGFAERLPVSRYQVSSGLLQWAEDPGRVLESWRTSLHADGKMVHAIPCNPCLCEWRSIVHESPVKWRDPASWIGIFQRSGLRIKRKVVWQESWRYSSALELVRGMHESGVTGQPRLSTGRLRQSIRRYDELYRASSGVPATWAWLCVEAVPA